VLHDRIALYSPGCPLTEAPTKKALQLEVGGTASPTLAGSELHLRRPSPPQLSNRHPTFLHRTYLHRQASPRCQCEHELPDPTDHVGTSSRRPSSHSLRLEQQQPRPAVTTNHLGRPAGDSSNASGTITTSLFLIPLRFPLGHDAGPTM
jgi:hypothetical protein